MRLRDREFFARNSTSVASVVSLLKATSASRFSRSASISPLSATICFSSLATCAFATMVAFAAMDAASSFSSAVAAASCSASVTSGATPPSARRLNPPRLQARHLALQRRHELLRFLELQRRVRMFHLH